MSDDARVTSRVALAEETQVERQLRPQRLDEYVGQKAAVESLRVSVEAARQRGEPLDHVLLSGPPGLGKTTLAAIMANEMGASIAITAGPSLERGADLMGILTNVGERDVLFIDEIHRLPRTVEELLYPAMEDFSINFVMDKGLNARTMRIPLRPFTMVGATTRPGMLSSPLRERFGIFHHLDFYSLGELHDIVARSASILGARVEDGGARAIAQRSRGTPRIANRLLRRVRDYVQVKGNGVTRPFPGCQIRVCSCVSSDLVGEFAHPGSGLGCGRVRGWRPRRALLSEGHAGPRRSCPGRKRAEADERCGSREVRRVSPWVARRASG